MLLYSPLMCSGGKIPWYQCLREYQLTDVEAHLVSPAALDLYLLGYHYHGDRPAVTQQQSIIRSMQQHWNTHQSPLFSSLSSSWFSLLDLTSRWVAPCLAVCTLTVVIQKKWCCVRTCTVLLSRDLPVLIYGWGWILQTRTQKNNSANPWCTRKRLL